MSQVPNRNIQRLIPIVMLIILLAFGPVGAQPQNSRPIANAGSSRYAAQGPVALDGTASYDPDDSGTLSYQWRQINGPEVFIVDANTARPSIGQSLETGKGRSREPILGGFIQTDAIQECTFELIVSDGELTSTPDTVSLMIVPDFGNDTLLLENPPFDSSRPTFIFFGGGDCVSGSGSWNNDAWNEKANIISFTNYSPDSSDGPRTYYRYGDMLIAYLSSVAPDYKQPIQTSGWSTGGQPAIDVGLRLNLTYHDPRYAVNHVTFLDATLYCRSYSDSIATFLDSSVEGEQCWVDNYVSTVTSQPPFHNSILNMATQVSRHSFAPEWYKVSLIVDDMKEFNNGLVAGAYWSVVGPGKNLQLASTPEAPVYEFKWYGSLSSGYMDYYDRLTYPAGLPEPVTLLVWSDALDPNDEPTGALLTCKESENAVGYELLFGSEPDRVMGYHVISDTPGPPTEIITDFPSGQTWWTIRVRDRYGSTIYADPIPVNLENLPLLTIENLTNGKRYGYIQHAIIDANSGDEIVVGPGLYQENISFRGKNLTLRSMDPNDPMIVEATIIDGGGDKSVVTFSGGEDASCVLAGFTVTGGSMGICCCIASPTITNCTIGQSGTVSIELWHGSEPTITDCNIPGEIVERPFAENLNSGMRYASIQRAIDDAINGEEIVLSEGIWEEKIDFKGKNLVVRSTNPEDSAVVAATIVIGDGNDSLVTFSGNEDAGCVLAGLTITGASEGIYCSGASPTIIGCGVSVNTGAGIKMENSSNPSIINCLISMNGGTGIEMWPLSAVRNAPYNYPVITNCTIVGNMQNGIAGSFPTITNSIIRANSLQQVAENIQATITYSDVQGGWPGEGNLDVDPLFADPDNGDYHLKSQAGRWDPAGRCWVTDDLTSPCIDAGGPAGPVGSEPDPNGGRINMGVFGGTVEAGKSP